MRTIHHSELRIVTPDRPGRSNLEVVQALGQLPKLSEKVKAEPCKIETERWGSHSYVALALR